MHVRLNPGFRNGRTAPFLRDLIFRGARALCSASQQKPGCRWQSFLLAVCLLCLSLTSCTRYSLAINDKVVYTPPAIFTDFRLDDLNLQRCVDATIKENRITAAEQLQSLDCPDQEITSLQGLKIFANLKILGLANNRLQNIEAIAGLKQLEQLNLAGNDVRETGTLAELKTLQFLNLDGNQNLNCRELAHVRLPREDRLIAPRHCQGKSGGRRE